MPVLITFVLAGIMYSVLDAAVFSIYITVTHYVPFLLVILLLESLIMHSYTKSFLN
jgi:general stress protein CsbA